MQVVCDFPSHPPLTSLNPIGFIILSFFTSTELEKHLGQCLMLVATVAIWTMNGTSKGEDFSFTDIVFVFSFHEKILLGWSMPNVDEGSTIPATDFVPPAEKRSRNKWPLSISPEKWGEPLCNIAGGCCIKCKDELGANSKAIQCDLCGSWINAACEKISDEVMNVILGSVNNFVYYCETNNCTSRIKQLLFSFFTGDSVEKPIQSQIATGYR